MNFGIKMAAAKLGTCSAALLIAFAVLATGGQTVPDGVAKSSPVREDAAVPLSITKVDDAGLLQVLKPDGRPLLVNFWATWCVPCREEFPDLVLIDAEYRGKIDFITVSLDDPVEINRDVPKFLREMRATMPAYLLRTADETAVIGSISDQWQGGLPFTVLYDTDGRIVYARQGKIKLPVMRGLLDPLLASGRVITVTEFIRTVNGKRDEALFYYRNNWKLLRAEAIKHGYIRSYEMIVAEPDSKADFEIILITRYDDGPQFERSEENFKNLIRKLRPEGPLYVNDLRPEEFRESISVQTGMTDPFP